jgi:hypothetical protein
MPVTAPAGKAEPIRAKPMPSDAPKKNPGGDGGPSASLSIETDTKNPFEQGRRHEPRVEHAPDYSWVTGQLTFVHADGGLWVLRYAPLDVEDPNGGSVVLARDVRMDDYREGDLVTVHGEIVSQRSSKFLGGPLYQVQSIQLVQRGVQP